VGARPGSASGYFKKATETPNFQHFTTISKNISKNSEIVPINSKMHRIESRANCPKHSKILFLKSNKNTKIAKKSLKKIITKNYKNLKILQQLQKKSLEFLK
jgi:hypothetical protein